MTPEQAHAIGVEFAKRMFGERYEVVIGTHLDQAHTHNHIVINAVSFQDGKRYHSSPESYYGEIRAASDALCREHQLSVITPQEHGKAYAEWKAEKAGKPTLRSMIRADIDSVIENAYSFETFLLLLEKRGLSRGEQFKTKIHHSKAARSKAGVPSGFAGSWVYRGRNSKKDKRKPAKAYTIGNDAGKKETILSNPWKASQKAEKENNRFFSAVFSICIFSAGQSG